MNGLLKYEKTNKNETYPVLKAGRLQRWMQYFHGAESQVCWMWGMKEHLKLLKSTFWYYKNILSQSVHIYIQCCHGGNITLVSQSTKREALLFQKWVGEQFSCICRDSSKTYWSLCRINFSIAHKWLSDVGQHAKQADHKPNPSIAQEQNSWNFCSNNIIK